MSIQSTKGTTISITYSTPDLSIIRNSNLNDPKAIHSQSNAMPMDREYAIKDRTEHYQNKRREMEYMHTGGAPKHHTAAGIGNAGHSNAHSNSHVIHNTYVNGDNANPAKKTSNIFLTVDERSQSDIHMKPWTTTTTTNSNVNGNEYGIRGNPNSFELIQEHGKVRYTLTNHDAAIICIKSLNASQLKPTFISIIIKEIDNVHLKMDVDLDNVHPSDGLTEEERRNRNVELDEGREHLKWLEREIHKLIARVNSIERSYRSSKETHGEFYQQSADMHGQFKWYAIVQLGVLVLTGVLNAKTIIATLKKKGFVY